MPGIIIFRRRWSIGSDDMILPSSLFFVIHTLLFFSLLFLFISIDQRDWRYPCMSELYEHSIGYFIILIGCMISEFCIYYISTKGTMIDNEPRSLMKYLLFVRFGILVVEIVWLSIGLFWFYNNYKFCNHGHAKEIIFLITISNSILIFIIIFIGWCFYDSAGSSWLKMKRYQNNLKENSFNFKYMRSNNTNRNWRHRETLRKYQDSWNRRCKLLFCCLRRSDRRQNSFSEVAKILSEFFRDLDVVPSDIITGLIIIRKYQKLQRKLILNNINNDIYDYMSGIPIRINSKFLDLNKIEVIEEIQTLIYYLDYAMAAYGWPLFVINKKTACCKLCPNLKLDCHCLNKNIISLNCFLQNKKDLNLEEHIFNINKTNGDNCCRCNYAALKSFLKNKNYDIIYASYHVEIGQPSFIVILDHFKKTLIISVRGTLSLKDIITDLNAEGNILPIKPLREKWMAHNGMIEAAIYIRNELFKNKIIEKAFNFNLEKNTQSYTLVLVGHSLGAGTVSLLAILLKEYYPDLVCYAFSPPGGLLSLDLVEYSKSFITSVVLGKDLVPRLGLHQMENLRFDLINAIKQSSDPKWKIIKSAFCCCKSSTTFTDEEILINLNSSIIGEPNNNFVNLNNSIDTKQFKNCLKNLKIKKKLFIHPQNSSISLTVHQPFYPPGKIIHIVRSHSSDLDKKIVKKNDVIYKALYVDNTEFDQILITPVIFHDHMPNKIKEGLQKLLLNSNKIIKNENYYRKIKFHCKNANKTNNFIKSLLLYQFNFNRENNTLKFKNKISLESNQKNKLEYSCFDMNKSNIDLDFNILNKLKKKNSFKHNTFFFNIISKIKNINFSENIFGKAPLATPETFSETSSICSQNYINLHSFTDRNNLKTVSENIIEKNILNETSLTKPTIKKETILLIEDQDSVKIDLSLNIDVNALFDKYENKFKNTFKPINKLTSTYSILPNVEQFKNNPKIIKRTSSFKRKNSISSLNSKRVTFDFTTGNNNKEKIKLDNRQFCRRTNSEKMNQRKNFSYYNNLKYLKLKNLKNKNEIQFNKNNLLNINNKKNNDEEDNVKNEKIEKQLEKLLGYSFNYSNENKNENKKKFENNLTDLHEKNEKIILNMQDYKFEKNLEDKKLKFNENNPHKNFILNIKKLSTNEINNKKNLINTKNIKFFNVNKDTLNFCNKKKIRKLF